MVIVRDVCSGSLEDAVAHFATSNPSGILTIKKYASYKVTTKLQLYSS